MLSKSLLFNQCYEKRVRAHVPIMDSFTPNFFQLMKWILYKTARLILFVTMKNVEGLICRTLLKELLEEQVLFNNHNKIPISLFWKIFPLWVKSGYQTWPKAATCRCSTKQMFLEHLKNSQENTCTDSNTSVSCEFGKIHRKHLFYQNTSAGSFWVVLIT